MEHRKGNGNRGIEDLQTSATGFIYFLKFIYFLETVPTSQYPERGIESYRVPQQSIPRTAALPK
jgi:hypothetical protein